MTTPCHADCSAGGCAGCALPPRARCAPSSCPQASRCARCNAVAGGTAEIDASVSLRTMRWCPMFIDSRGVALGAAL